MKVFLFSCFLYLLGIVVVLYLKPEFMFDKKGSWKEFGFVSTDRYTWFPFWLFCILWGILSYAICNFIFRNKKEITSIPKSSMKPGYYMLDKEESIQKGIPKYVYLGPDVPE